MKFMSLEQISVLQSFIDYNDKKRLLFCLPESAGDIFLSTSLLPSLKENYPDFDIYFACKKQYKDILKNNPYIHKVIDYLSVMENVHIMEGVADWPPLFDISLIPSAITQRYINYHHNGIDVSRFSFRK